MTKIKSFFNFLDTVFFSVWGLTIIDLIPIIGISSVDNLIKTLMAAVGFVYFALSIPHKRKIQKLERKLKEQELEKLTKENDKNE